MKKILSIALICLFANLSFGLTNFETSKHKTETIVSQFESTNVDCPFVAVNFVAANSFPEIVLQNDFLIKNIIVGDVIVDKENAEILKLLNSEFPINISKKYNLKNFDKYNKFSGSDFSRIKDLKTNTSLMLQKNHNKFRNLKLNSFQNKELKNYLSFRL